MIRESTESNIYHASEDQNTYLPYRSCQMSQLPLRINHHRNHGADIRWTGLRKGEMQGDRDDSKDEMQKL